MSGETLAVGNSISNPLLSSPLRGQPRLQKRSDHYKVWVSDAEVDVLWAESADFAVLECPCPVEFLVRTGGSMEGACIRPLSREITASGDGTSLRFSVQTPQNICVDVPGQKPLFLYINFPEPDRPDPRDPLVHYYAAGQIHEVGQLDLRSGETLYIEAGAVVRGCVRSSQARDVRICGHGILDGSGYSFAKGDRVQSIIFEQCEGVVVEDIVMIEPTSWMLVIGCCTNVRVRNLRQIGTCMSSDGIDICGSKDVIVEDCCLRNNDDNIAIKSLNLNGRHSWRGNVENIRIRRCLFLNGQCGNAMEIGYELSADRVSRIVFEDIDVIGAHGEGAVFSIHNGDHATVEDVVWENIRVEHYWDKLVDFRVIQSRYSKDTTRGTIRGVRLKNIHVTHSEFNPGCSISLISGFQPSHPVEDVVFEDFHLNGDKVLDGDQLELHTRNALNVRFV